MVDTTITPFRANYLQILDNYSIGVMNGIAFIDDGDYSPAATMVTSITECYNGKYLNKYFLLPQ